MTRARMLVYGFVNYTARLARQAISTADQSRYNAVEAGSDEDLQLLDLLNRVEDDRAHAEAVKLREYALTLPDYRPPKHGTTGRTQTLVIADRIDPYHMVDGQLVRKSDGKPVII